MDNGNGRAHRGAIGPGARCLVVGGGIVGVSVATHLLRRGVAVTLVDRRGPGEETSYGNSGVVEREGLIPITFPASLGALARFALNRTTAAHYHVRALPRVWPWLMMLRRNSAPGPLAAYARASNALQAGAAAEHAALAGPAGATGLFRDTGWLRLYRTPESFAGAGRALLARAREFGLDAEELTPEEVAATLEPSLAPVYHRAILWPQTRSVSSPGDVTRAYARQFVAEGGRLVRADVSGLAPNGAGWRVALAGTADEPADAVVVAAGPWSPDLLAPLGFRPPMIVKRGYHRHYRPVGNAALARPVVDMDEGYVITPMKDGIRLTTGVEFADRDTRATPVQIDRALARARGLFPLGEPVEAEPWRGARPCLPDNLPMIGPAPGRPGLWLAIGHGHLGFTEGPLTGRLLSEMMTGAAPVIDPAPYRADRFANGRASAGR